MTEDIIQIRDSVDDFLAAQAPVSHMRGLRDAGDPLGLSLDLWRRFGDMGYAGLLIDEVRGGMGLSLVEACVVMEALGRNLTPSPFLSTAGLAAVALGEGGTEMQRAAYLPRIAQANGIIALALQEKAKFSPFHVRAAARRAPDGWRLSGTKTLVLDGMAADTLLVTARTSGAPDDPDGITLFLVPVHSSGVARERVVLADHRSVARVTLRDVAVGRDAVLGEPGGAAQLLERLAQMGAIATAAELLGVAGQALRMTLEYLKMRRQFGALIGEFQALQHRAAKMYVDIEVARPAVAHAARAWAGREAAGLHASVAKAKACAVSGLIVREAVQMHGGIGVTDELDLGFYMKRQRVLAETFGDERFHLDAFAAGTGY